MEKDKKISVVTTIESCKKYSRFELNKRQGLEKAGFLQPLSANGALLQEKKPCRTTLSIHIHNDRCKSIQLESTDLVCITVKPGVTVTI